MPKEMRYWLVKQEPEDYSWDNFAKDGGTDWTGVRNYQARNFLQGMKKGDSVFFYHSGKEKQIVGIAKVEGEAVADSTADEPGWVMVRLKPVKALAQPITLVQLKSNALLKQMLFVRQSRLSVSSVTQEEADEILRLASK